MHTAIFLHRKRLAQLIGLMTPLCFATSVTLAQTAPNNIAQGQSISASSYADVYSATQANDGNSSSYWESQNNSFPQTLSVDLGQSRAINQVALTVPANWGSRTQTITLLASSDGANYDTLVNQSSYMFDPADGNRVTLNFAEANARYVRLSISANSGWAAGQIAEFEVYGADQTNNQIRYAYDKIDVAQYDGMSGVQTEPTTDTGGGNNIGWIDNGDWVRLNNVDFGASGELNGVSARVASNHSGGTIEFHLDSTTGPLLGSLAVNNTGGWQNWTTATGSVATSGGIHDLYLVFNGSDSGGLFNVNWIEFDSGTATLPATPQGLAVNNTSATSVSLSWDSAAYAQGYDILRNGAVVDSTTSTQFVDSGLSANTAYTYVIRAYNSDGQSSPSASVSATTDSEVTPPDNDNVALDKPVSASSSGPYHLQNNTVDGDQSTYWESASNSFPQRLTVDLGSTHYIDQINLTLPDDMAWESRSQTLSIRGSNNGTDYTSIKNSAAYHFDPNNGNRVSIAFNEVGTRFVQLEINDNTGWPAAQISELEVYGYPDPVPPNTPQNVTIAGGTSSTLYLLWDEVALADGYRLLRDGNEIADISANSFQDTGLAASTDYSYTLIAYNEFGESANSSPISGTTQAEGTDPDPNDGRGASMPYSLYQAEDGQLGGNAQALAPNRIIGDLAGEASGRQAVTLSDTGDYVAFTSDEPTNTLVTRFSIPDAPGGGGIDSTLNIYVDGQFEKAIELTSKHAWLYGDETQPNNNPSSGPARHIYDEAHVMFDRTIPAGSNIRLQKDAANTSEYTIDFISLEQVSAIPNPNPAAYITPTGFSHQDVQNAINEARMSNTAEGVYLPPGTYETAYKFQVYGKPLNIVGAGPWYTKFTTPQSQTNTDAGFMVNNSANGSTFANFAFFGNYTSRIDGPGKVFDFSGVSDMTIDNIWAEHQVCMFWGSSVHNTTIKNSRIRNTFADGLNFTNGSSGNHISNIEARSTGDDSFALFGATDNGGGVVQDNLYENLTAMTPWRAAGLAAYGGQGNTFRNIRVEDTLTYSGLTISSLDFGYAFTGFQANPTTNFEDITIARSGGQFWGDQVFPALWMFSASDTFQGIRINNLDIIDPTFHGIMFQTNYVGNNAQNPIADTVLDNVTISGARIDPRFPDRSGFGIWANPMPEAGQGPAVGSVTFTNLTLTNNAINIRNQTPDFTINIE